MSDPIVETFDVVEPSLDLKSCDFCYETQADMIGGELREMLRLRDGCLICEECLPIYLSGGFDQ